MSIVVSHLDDGHLARASRTSVRFRKLCREDAAWQPRTERLCSRFNFIEAERSMLCTEGRASTLLDLNSHSWVDPRHDAGWRSLSPFETYRRLLGHLDRCCGRAWQALEEGVDVNDE